MPFILNVQNLITVLNFSGPLLSESVSKALQFTGGPDVEETAKFAGTFDKFFDALNVSNYTEGVRHRKPFQLPYRSSSDFWLKACA